MSRFDPVDPTLLIFEVEEGSRGYLARVPAIEAERHTHEILSFGTEPGDVILFHTSALHGGGANVPGTPERRTLTLRYFSEDCYISNSPGPAAPFVRNIQDMTE